MQKTHKFSNIWRRTRKWWWWWWWRWKSQA
jgi:hypothetical protein